ncbi:MAG: MG2 domain-containing protein [Cyanobacteriota bacterium]
MWKWIVAAVLFIALIAVGILLEKPKGNIVGNLSLQETTQSGYRYVYNTDNLLKSNARVIAYGPVVRGAFVNSKGEYRINGLPVGTYRLMAKAKGYSSDTQWGIEVVEAKDTGAKEFKLSYLPSSIDIASDSKVFTTDDNPYFWFRTTGIEKIDIKLYSFNALEDIDMVTEKAKDDYASFLLGNYYYGSDQFIKDIVKDKRPIKNWDKKVFYGSDDYGRTPLKIEKDLPKGSYLLVVEGDSDLDKVKRSDAYWFSVSDLGIITKHDPYKVLIRAIDLRTLKPVSDAKVSIYDRQKDYKLVGEAKTDNNGMVEYSFPEKFSEGYNSLLITAESDRSIALNGSYSWFYNDDKYKVYLYTDRPVYRPNQTVYFKAIVREEEKGRIKNIVDKPVDITIYNPDDEPIKRYKLKTNQFGTYHAYIDMPNNAMLGSYRIKSEIDDSEYSNYFELAEYRKPEYKVDVIPGSQRIIGGQLATATVKATYFFGYPVTNAKVKYTVYSSPDYGLKWELLPRPDYYSYYDDWDDNDSYDYSGYDYSSGEVIAEGYATTDENGEAKVKFKTKKIKADLDTYYSYSESVAQKYKVEAEVTDISRKTSVGKGAFNVVAGEFALFLEPERYVYTEDEDIKIDVKAINYDKKYVSTDVELALQSWDWDSENWVYKNPKTIATKVVKTDKNGESVAIMKVPKNAPTRNYRIVGMAVDREGNKIADTTSIWISNMKYPSYKSEVKPNLEVTFDKSVYQAGDVAKVMLVSPIKDVQAMVCLEGAELYNYKLYDIKDNTQLIEIPLTDLYVPNAYVSVVIVGPRQQYYAQNKLIRVSPENNFLDIDIKPDKAKYMPQETVNYDIKVTDSDGKPVKAELSVAVVDESIYSIRSDYTPDIKKFFYSRVSNMVQTAYSFYKDYSAGGDKIEPKLRKDFKDTALWRAEVVTNDKGEAKVSFKLPDNLTTWRTTVRAVTKDTKVASATNNILVTKDIIVRLALPRFYTVGDKAILASIVHNYTDEEQKIKLDLRAPSNFKVGDSKQKPVVDVYVPPQGKIRKDWDVEAKVVGDVKIQTYAIAYNTKIEGDALELPISILPFGVPKISLKSGKMIDDNAKETIDENITEKVVPGSISWIVRVSPSNASMVLGSLDYLISYPYGCTEQTMSKFMPSIVVANISNELGIPLSKSAKVKLPDVVDDSLTRLYKNQHSDGGWGWWEYDDSNAYMTAYVLHGLKYAMNSGYKIEKNRIDRALVWLTDQLKDKKTIEISKGLYADEQYYYRQTPTDLAYQCYVLSLYGMKNDTILTNLYQRRDKISNEALAYLALSYAQLGVDEKANVVLDVVLSRVDVQLPILSFGMTKTLLERFGISLDSLYSYNEVEISAIVMRAMLKVRPDDPMVDKIVPLLLEKRHGNYWYNTKTTATVILALSEYIKYTAMEENPDYDVIVKLGNREISRKHFNRSNMFSEETIVEIPAKLIAENNSVTIEKSGIGKMYYSSDFKYYQYFEADEVIPAVTDNNIILTKELYKLKTKTDEDGNIKYEKLPFKGDAKAGEVLLVRLELENNDFGQYIIIEDPKASGMELVASDPHSKLGSSFDDKDDYYWWNNWWTHQSDKDTHMAFFVTYLPKGKHEFYYLIRPELPGEYLIRPTNADGMYSSIISGSTTSMKIKVKE